MNRTILPLSEYFNHIDPINGDAEIVNRINTIVALGGGIINENGTPAIEIVNTLEDSTHTGLLKIKALHKELLLFDPTQEVKKVLNLY